MNSDPDLGTGLGRVLDAPPDRHRVRFFGLADLDGQRIRYDVRGVLRLDGLDAFAGRYRTTFSDLDGNVLFTDRGELKGKRLAQ